MPLPSFVVVIIIIIAMIDSFSFIFLSLSMSSLETFSCRVRPFLVGLTSILRPLWVGLPPFKVLLRTWLLVEVVRPPGDPGVVATC